MICGAVLAAGASTRLGGAIRKQLIEIDGEPAVRRTARFVRAACDRACVVLGAFAGDIAPALAGLDLVPIDNAAWAEGMGSSVRGAAVWARAIGAEALLVAVCDQPRLTAAHVAALVERWRAGGAAVVGSAYAGAIGVPAVFGASRFDDLALLAGDRGARALLAGAAAVDFPGGEIDLDVPADLA